VLAVAAHITAVLGLLLGFVAAVLMYYFPARVIQFTGKGEGQITWVNNPTDEGKRKGRTQIFLSKTAPWLLAAAFLLQLPTLMLPLFEVPPMARVSHVRGVRQGYESTNGMDEDLRHSQLCAKVAKEFRSQPEWQSKDEPRTFTSHYNKKLGKCLVKVTSSNVVSGVVLEMQHVYDALEGTVLGGEILRKELPSHSGEQKTLTITMVRDGKILKDQDEAREAYQWFETLMKE